MIDMRTAEMNTLTDRLAKQANSLKHSIECNAYAFGELPFLSLNEVQLHENELATATTLNISFRHLLDNDLYLNNLFSEKVSAAYSQNGYFSVVDVSNPKDLSLADISLLSTATDLVVGTSGTDAELFCLQPKNETLECTDYSNKVDQADTYSFLDNYRMRRVVKLNEAMTYLYIPTEVDEQTGESTCVVRRLNEVANMGGVGAATSFPLSFLNSEPPKGEAAIVTDLCENQFYGKCVLSQENKDSTWALVNDCRYFIATANKGLYGVTADGSMKKVEFFNSKGISHYVMCEFHILNEEPVLFIVTKQSTKHGTDYVNRLFYVSLSDYPPLFNGSAMREVVGVNVDGVNNPIQGIWDLCDYGENPVVLPESGGVYGFDKFKYGFPTNNKNFLSGNNKPWRVQVWSNGLMDVPFTTNPKTGKWSRLRLNTLELPYLCEATDKNKYKNFDNQGWYWRLTTSGFDGKRIVDDIGGDAVGNCSWSVIANPAYTDDLKKCALADVILATKDLLMVRGAKGTNTFFAFIQAGVNYIHEAKQAWYKVKIKDSTSGLDFDLYKLLEDNAISSLPADRAEKLLNEYFGITKDNSKDKIKRLAGEKESDYTAFVKKLNEAAKPPKDEVVQVKYVKANSAKTTLVQVIDFTSFKIAQIRKLLTGKYASEIKSSVEKLKLSSYYSPPASVAEEAAESMNAIIDANLDAFKVGKPITDFMTITRSKVLTSKDISVGQTVGTSTLSTVDTQISNALIDEVNLLVNGLGAAFDEGINWMAIATSLKESTKYKSYSNYAKNMLAWNLGKSTVKPTEPSNLPAAYKEFDSLWSTSFPSTALSNTLEHKVLNSDERYMYFDFANVDGRLSISSWQNRNLKKETTSSETNLLRDDSRTDDEVVYAHAPYAFHYGTNFTPIENENITFDETPKTTTSMNDEGQGTSTGLGNLLKNAWMWDGSSSDNRDDIYDEDDDGSVNEEGKQITVTLNNLEGGTKYLVQMVSHNGKDYRKKDVFPRWWECSKATCWRNLGDVPTQQATDSMKLAAWRIMCCLSPSFTEGHFQEYINWAISQGSNTVHLFLCNFADYSRYEKQQPPNNPWGETVQGYSPWGTEPLSDDKTQQKATATNWWNSSGGDRTNKVLQLDPEEGVCKTMLDRIKWIRDQGLAVVLWLCADDSTPWNQVFLQNHKNIIAEMSRAGFFDYASIIVPGLECDEYWTAAQTKQISNSIREVYNGKIGIHTSCNEVDQNDMGWYRPGYLAGVNGPGLGVLGDSTGYFYDAGDLMFYQTPLIHPGTRLADAEEQIRHEVKYACQKTKKPVCYFELDRTANYKLSQAALDGLDGYKAFGVGNCQRSEQDGYNRVSYAHPDDPFNSYGGLSICGQATRPLSDCAGEQPLYKFGCVITGKFQTPSTSSPEETVSQPLTLTFSGHWTPVINAIVVRKISGMPSDNSYYQMPSEVDYVSDGTPISCTMNVTTSGEGAAHAYTFKVNSSSKERFQTKILKSVYSGTYKTSLGESYADYLDAYYIKKNLFKIPGTPTSPYSFAKFAEDSTVAEQSVDIQLSPDDDSASITEHLETVLGTSILSSVYSKYKDKKLSLNKNNFTMKEASKDTDNDTYTMTGSIVIKQSWGCKEYKKESADKITTIDHSTPKTDGGDYCYVRPTITIKFSVEFSGNVQSGNTYGLVNGTNGVTVTIQSVNITDSATTAFNPSISGVSSVLITSSEALTKLKSNADMISYIKNICGFDTSAKTPDFLNLLKVSSLDTSGTAIRSIDGAVGTKQYVFTVRDEMSYSFDGTLGSQEKAFINELSQLASANAFANPYAGYDTISEDDSDCYTWSDKFTELTSVLSTLQQHKSDDVLPSFIDVDAKVSANVTADSWVNCSLNDAYETLIGRVAGQTYQMVRAKSQQSTPSGCFPDDSVLATLLPKTDGVPAELHARVMEMFLDMLNSETGRNGTKYSLSPSSLPDIMFNSREGMYSDRIFGISDKRVLFYDYLKVQESVRAKLKEADVHTFDVDPMEVKVLPFPCAKMRFGCTSGSSLVYWLEVPNPEEKQNTYGMTGGIHAYVDEPNFKGFLDVVDFGDNAVKHVVAVAYSPYIGKVFVMAEDSTDIYAFDVESLELKNDLVYDLNVSKGTVYKTALSGCDTNKVTPDSLFLSDRNENTYTRGDFDGTYNLVATFLNNEDGTGVAQRFEFTAKLESSPYSTLALTNSFSDVDMVNVNRQFSDTPICSISKTDEGLAMVVNNRLLRGESGYLHTDDMSLCKTFPKIIHTSDAMYCDYVLDKDLALNCITIPQSMKDLYPYSKIDLAEWFPQLKENAKDLIVYDIDMSNWTTGLGVSYVIVYTNQGVYMIDMGRVPHTMRYGSKEAIIKYFVDRVLDKLKSHTHEKHHDKTLLSRFYNTRRFLNKNEIYDFVSLTTDVKYGSPTERHGGHSDNSNVSVIVDKQVFFGGSMCCSADENPGVVFAAVNTPITKYDSSWYKAQVSSPIVDTQFYDYFYRKEVSPVGLEIIKNVLDLNHLPFIYRHNTDNTWDMWVNIPSTMTPYMNRIVGSTMNSKGGKLKVENNYALARKNIANKFIVSDPQDQATTVRLFINPNHFHINSITDVVVNGSSLPMYIYRADDCNDGLFDGVQLQTVWNKVVQTVTDKHGVSYVMIEFKVWGSDEQSIHLSGGIATKEDEA